MYNNSIVIPSSTKCHRHDNWCYTEYQERSPTALLKQDEENQNADNFPQNKTECSMKLNRNEINGNVEIADCGLDVRSASVNQNCTEDQDLGKMIKIQRETTVLETNKSLGSEELGPSESNIARLVDYVEDPDSNMKHILNGADLAGIGGDMQHNASPSEKSCASRDEGSNELWSDFAGYCKTSLVQQQFFGTYCELPLREKGDSAERSSLQQSSKVPNSSFKNHRFPVQHHKSSTNREYGNEPKPSILITNACAPEFSTLKLIDSVNTEEELLSGNNPGQSTAFADNNLADSPVKWTSFEGNGQLVNGTFQTVDCNESEFSGFGTNGGLCPTSTLFSQNQEILSASSALKNAFPSEPVRHSFEDITTLEKLLEINEEENDANKAKTSTSHEFSSAWEVLQDLNKVALRSCWNVSHAREKLLSTLGIDQNQKDIVQADLQFLDDTMASCSDLDTIRTLPEVTAVPENGTKTLIQTRISVTPSQRISRSFTHRLETAFVQWLQMNGNRVQAAPRIKRNSLFL
ncbi:uncharacterized protein [Heptranchias perlo]|uniref:uncharacterized protein isoform X2 n=1 Tax=Heptranchias perlo TaxID=212740 RepID=UPI00355AB611